MTYFVIGLCLGLCVMAVICDKAHRAEITDLRKQIEQDGKNYYNAVSHLEGEVKTQRNVIKALNEDNVKLGNDLARRMALKKTDNCCRYCKHRGWGRATATQLYDTIVCLLRPKIYKNTAHNAQPHYFATRMECWCEQFERRDEL